jgi:AcrR family transcriptional regulator
VAEGVLRVLAVQGFAGLTLRAVAAELGATTGVVTHYFATKEELESFALELLTASVEQRSRPFATTGLATVRALVLGMLPTTSETASANRVWVSSWDVVLPDRRRTSTYAKTYDESRERLESAIRDAQDLGEVVDTNPTELATILQSFALGLAVQAVLDPADFPPSRQVALANALLSSITQFDRSAD